MEYQNNELTDTAVRTYGKTELALMYNPHSSPRAAVQTLKRWIQCNTELSEKLDAIGYRPKRHTIYSPEAELIFKYIGKP
jgi:hypothetical protein